MYLPSRFRNRPPKATHRRRVYIVYGQYRKLDIAGDTSMRYMETSPSALFAHRHIVLR